MILITTYLPLFFISWALTGLFRRYALKKKVLDIPNQRSSHTVPTPRGGGLAFVACFLSMLVVLVWNKRMEPAHFEVVFIASMIVAVLGFWDDHYHLSAKSRLLGHFIAGSFMLFWFGGASSWVSFSSEGALILANVCLVTYLVWFINLYNFMDGIDGLAAIESVTVCLGGALLYAIDGQFEFIVLPLLLACSVAGFLIWNFPPARIFMGDVGSGFLGLLMGSFSLFAAKIDRSLLVGWLILNGVFLCDASITLLRRLWRKENIFKAHCSHAYQHAARRYQSHTVVTLVILGVNCVWLLPIAVLVQQRVFSELMGISIAFAPLILLVLKFGTER